MSEPDPLLTRAVDGDREALSALLERHGPDVRRALHGKIPARWQAVLSLDDVLQQAYADAFLSIGSFALDRDGSFGGWLHTIARRNLVDTLRSLGAAKRGGGRRQVARVATEGESVVSLYELLSGSTSTPSRHAARDEAAVALRDVLTRLPEPQRRAVELYDLELHTPEQAAAALGRSIGAMFMLRARAHRRLRDLLGSAARYFSDPGR